MWGSNIVKTSCLVWVRAPIEHVSWPCRLVRVRASIEHVGSGYDGLELLEQTGIGAGSQSSLRWRGVAQEIVALEAFIVEGLYSI